MSLTTSVQIANLALGKVGYEGSGIDALDDDNEAARKCNLFYEPIRDLVMAEHPWKFALKKIYWDYDDFDTDISAITAANPAVCTSSSHNITEGRGVYIWDTGDDDWDDAVYYAQTVSGSDITLYKLDRATGLDGSSYSAATTGKCRPAPMLDFDYEYELPSDYLAFHQLLSSNYGEWEIEDGWIQTDDDEFGISYISLVTTVSKYPEWFIEAVVTRLAAELATALANKSELRKDLLVEYEKIVLPRAYQHNAIEAYSHFRGLRYDPDDETTWQSAGR